GARSQAPLARRSDRARAARVGGDRAACRALGSSPRMSTVHVTTRIEAPLGQVWETVMDPDRLEDWVTIQRWVKDVSSRPMEEGSTMRQCLHLRGVSFN